LTGERGQISGQGLVAGTRECGEKTAGNNMARHISSGSDFERDFGYSRAVIDRDMVHVAGTTGYDYERMILPDDAGEQARNTLGTIEKTLEEAGCSLDDVVRVRYYISDVKYLETIKPIVAKAFARARPAATLVIASLIEPGMKIEIEVTARIGAFDS